MLTLRHYAVLALVALILFLPGRSSLPAIDRDESRYMQATSQMLETGNFIDVRFQDVPRYLQPAGIYWLEALSVAALSDGAAKEPWAYRIPSLLSAIAAVLLTGWIGSMLFGTTAGMIAALLLAASLLMGAEARMAKIDATLLAAILVAQAALMKLYLDPGARRGWAWLHWAALGVGLMLKGPLILLVSWGTIVGLVASERRVAWLARLHAQWGIPLMLAIVLPWMVAIGITSGGEFFQKSFGDNFLGKVATGQQAHGGPPGYYLGTFAVAFWPGSLFAVLALPFAWAQRRTPGMRFLLAWIIPTWLVFEAIATKLPHYVLPTYPAIACFTAAAVLAPGAWQFGRVWRWIGGIYGAVWLLIGVGLAIAGPVVLWVLERQVGVLPILAGLLGIVLMAAAARAASRGWPLPAMGLSGTAALVLFASTYAGVLPRLDTIWLSPRIAAAVASVRPCPDSVLASSSYSEPSLIFHAGRSTRLVPPAAAADHLVGPCELALIGTREEAAFQARLEELGIVPRALATVAGVNYSTGRRLLLTLYARP
ncbi:MAG: glycosyltransferase family 39 protein [Gemmatimonadaceae bacterium]|nr:glycosyltransferase family 39 protein [Acetobacteraceae bacterium]